MSNAKTFLWGAFPPTPMHRHGSAAAFAIAPIPRGTVIPEDCIHYEPTREALDEWIAGQQQTAKAKKKRDTRTGVLFEEVA